jgi:hypothetical protein
VARQTAAALTEPLLSSQAAGVFPPDLAWQHSSCCCCLVGLCRPLYGPGCVDCLLSSPPALQQQQQLLLPGATAQLVVSCCRPVRGPCLIGAEPAAAAKQGKVLCTDCTRVCSSL